MKQTNFTAERCLAYAYLAKMADIMQLRQSGKLSEQGYRTWFEHLADDLEKSLNCGIQRDIKSELPHSNEIVLIQLQSDVREFKDDCLKKVCYEVSWEDGKKTHWFSQDGEFYCEVEDVAFWWRLPNMPESDEYSEVMKDD